MSPFLLDSDTYNFCKTSWDEFNAMKLCGCERDAPLFVCVSASVYVRRMRKMKVMICLFIVIIYILIVFIYLFQHFYFLLCRLLMQLLLLDPNCLLAFFILIEPTTARGRER